MKCSGDAVPPAVVVSCPHLGSYATALADVAPLMAGSVIGLTVIDAVEMRFAEGETFAVRVALPWASWLVVPDGASRRR